MKYIITKIVDNQSMNDAVKFPDMGKTAVVEDYEMAAYHNQA